MIRPAAVLLLIVLALAAGSAGAQTIPFVPPPAGDAAALTDAMARLAGSVATLWRATDRDRTLDTLFRLRIDEGDWAGAAASLAELRRLRGEAAPRARARNRQYDVFVGARLESKKRKRPFEAAFASAFARTLAGLDDQSAALLARAVTPFPVGISLHAPVEEDLAAAMARQAGKTEISLADAVTLLRAWQVAVVARRITPLVAPIVAADDARRYRIAEAPVTLPSGTTVCALIVRPRRQAAPLPTLLEFTIYADPQLNLAEARRTASHGYVGVQGLTRGKGCGRGRPVPNEYDGEDAAALIDWIARQSWSDGRVGMFGGSYDGFTQWAAAKHHPAALKAIMPAVTEAPGIDSPREGGVMLSFGYYWPFYTTDNKTLDQAAFSDRRRWNALFRKWYVSGRAYRDLGAIDGTPNPVWDRWVAHPDYDLYWRSMIPFGDEFADIHIPVLTTTGYYDGGQIGALYYLTQHYLHDPWAEHYLVVGPYDHHTGNRGTVDVQGDEVDGVQDYAIDRAAHIDLGELRYQWFDHVLRGAPLPAILKDRVNYEVMGADLWRHAPSLAAMAPDRLRLYLAGGPAGGVHALSQAPPDPGASTRLTLDLADRSDVDRVAPTTGDIVDTALDTFGSALFETAPFAAPAEVSGLFSGHLDLMTNKKDFDVEIALYQLTPQGRYFALSTWLSRASYVGDLTRRRLLTPNVPQTLDFQAGRLTSRAFSAGDRLVVLVSLIRMPQAQINYGSGKPVADETIADAGAPLTVDWRAGSYLDVPFRGAAGFSLLPGGEGGARGAAVGR